MKITKLAHSCLLVEMPEPISRTVLFDPGQMSAGLVRAANLVYLDDIVITHEHFDHFDAGLVKELADRFPEVRILAPQSVVDKLAAAGVRASAAAPDGMQLFDAPHEDLAPLGPRPQAIGVHYLDALTHPGDSHSFAETKDILALPVTAPWGTTMRAATLIAELRPRYVIPVHDWMWKDEWRTRMYDGLAQFCQQQDVSFIKPVDGKPFVLEVTVQV